MHFYIKIFKDGKFIKEDKINQTSSEIYTFMWHKVEEEGSYSFKIGDKLGEEKGNNVIFSHTAPFSKTFEAYLSDEEGMKPISGFREGEDILIVFNNREKNILLKRMKFTRYKLDLKKHGIDLAKKVEMPASFNGWNIGTTVLSKIDSSNFETILALDDGIYEYKLVVDGKWIPDGENLRLIIGEMGWIFPSGEIGNGKFIYDSFDENDSRKAIKHNPLDLNYLNKISNDEVEITIRTQVNDIEKINLHIMEENDIEEIYEMERIFDKAHNFDYFKSISKLRINCEKFKYYFELIDGNNKAYYGNDLLNFSEYKYFEIDYSTGVFPVFDVPKWAKEAIWYNIFPDRFYNGNKENDPLYNEFGPECFMKPKTRSKLIEEYKWGLYTEQFGEFENNNWNSDFEKLSKWEKLKGLDVNYSLKYARMYGGDLKGLKEKIPYLKELGINAIWLNPVFFSESNHKYGAADFRHISPDFGTIKMTGSVHDVKISKENKYGNKSYIDILDGNIENKSELIELRAKFIGEKKGKNGYLETEDPETWVWTESDLIAVDLIKELHKNGIRVIFDGVFNHSGTCHWSFELAMVEGKKSKYSNWYRFHDFSKYKKIEDNMTEEEAYKLLLHNKSKVHYSGWAGFNGLPEFNTYNKEMIEYINNITRKWLLGPDGKTSDNWMEDDGIDGFRLDVPNCLENQNFWIQWRTVVKEAKKDAYITAELWGDARSEINEGIKYDTVMNYEWLKTTIAFFINQGKEFNSSYKLSPSEFFSELKEKRYWYPLQSLQVSQNLNGSHDTDRLLSRIINDKVGRDLEEGKQLEKGYNTIRPDLADKSHPNTSIDWIKSDIKPKDILKLISIFQMTYIGAPMLFYGDEVGMWGATDPYCRKPMLWDEFDFDDETNGSKINKKEKYNVEIDYDLLNWYKKIIKIRKENKTLVYGEFKEALSDDKNDVIAYERYDDVAHFVIIINNNFKAIKKIKVYSKFENEIFIELLSGVEYKSNHLGIINLDLDAKKGLILKRIK